MNRVPRSHALDGDGAYWRARERARAEAAAQVYVDPADGARGTLRELLDRLKLTEPSVDVRAARIAACTPVE